ncbi:MAG: hypothetical protein KatS3mg104_0760 [Phycisphaerae bacterium]|nr:MAG: hypothetical protein KatS3mg104_0760 [Phycisphaerae bacterium]
MFGSWVYRTFTNQVFWADMPEDASQLEINCPLLHTAKDFDGTVARAYRVNSPTLIVVDPSGVIRGRTLLSQPSWMLSVTEVVNSLNSSGPAIKSIWDSPRAER